MKRLLWLGVGLAVGALVVRKLNQKANEFTPTGIATSLSESAGGLVESLRSFVDDVRDGMAEREQQIHEAFAPLAPTRMTSRGGDGAEVRFLPAYGDTAVDVADEAVNLLLDAGWFPGSIALLTTGKRHWVQVQETERLGKKGYWRSFWEDDEVFYGHVLGCKGLERPAVVLCINESEHLERSTEKLYVGMSRATDHLIVVGDPAVVREIGGEAVATRLGIG